jgi:hypothetical protein
MGLSVSAAQPCVDWLCKDMHKLSTNPTVFFLRDFSRVKDTKYPAWKQAKKRVMT